MSNVKDRRLFWSLLLWNMLPALYLLIRMKIVAVSNTSINILGQLEWFDLIDEVLVTALTVPLFKILPRGKKHAGENTTAFIISFSIYAVFAVIVAVYINSIAKFMQAPYATDYLRWQTFSFLIQFATTFIFILLEINTDFKSVYRITAIKLVLLAISDWIYISIMKSVGAALSEITVNSIIAVYLISYCLKHHYLKLKPEKINFVRSWLRIGIFAAGQIFLDNWIYAIMVVKLVNSVHNSGNYWIANNFIWGWLLLPMTALEAVIKKNKLTKLTFSNTFKYLTYISLFWLVTLPLWKFFILNLMSADASKILPIVYFIMPFYLLYLVSDTIDSWLVSHGKTYYNFVISVIVNIGYYGIFYYICNYNQIQMNTVMIILMFGGGMLVHCICSIFCYYFEIQLKEKLQQTFSKSNLYLKLKSVK